MSTSTTYIADQQRIFNISNENNNFQTLVSLFSIKREEHRDFSCLEQTIRRLDFDFYNDLLPTIAKWASDHTQSKLVEPLQADTTATIVYTAAQARYILANAFFLNTIPGYGNIDLNNLYNSLFENLAVERIRCLIEYFRLSSQQNDDNRQISIERYSYKNELPDWSKQNISIESSKMNIFTDRMEDANEAQGFVDFANKHIHIHRIISSATQEEVLFSCCPEAFLSILICETLQDDEIVILRGCKRFINYTGYGDTFRYKGHYHEQNPTYIQDILVMDACYNGQFTRNIIDRDLGKAWAAFDKSKDAIIVTGNWGCGVFGGDLIFKFLQQLCAIMILGDYFKRLDYSVYGDEKLASKLKYLLENLEKKKKTVADIYQMMINYSLVSELRSSRPEFSDYCDKWLNAL
ncbi:unnamed protein product [Rotaria sp. Silwood1]|nr:unnamed protein product [Rotaria sp. Silwood1]CAF3365831.1 unnamed protein product [Rotaria sp. Silwood1]CAF3384238.1 unnamed protein product [Rotaria sp. Silwood1]CAF4578908.1 unnamed protein product [Rotaria sp. Silwood1]CAF4625532.1 unnamed protein product [Rotaria sp. Silwood1]